MAVWVKYGVTECIMDRMVMGLLFMCVGMAGVAVKACAAGKWCWGRFTLILEDFSVGKRLSVPFIRHRKNSTPN